MGGCAHGQAAFNDDMVVIESDGIDSSEMRRRLSSGTDVTRVPSRLKNVGDVLDARPSSRSLSELSVASSSFSGRLSRTRGAGITRRMSRIGSFARSEFISGIRRMSDSRDAKDRLNLTARLATFGMEMKEMKGDGNCQFRSFAYNLFGRQSHHLVTRNAAVEHMRRHSDFFSIFFEDQEEFDAYLHEMQCSRTWGDELTLRAVVEAYSCEVHVITSEPANWYLLYEPEGEEHLDPSVAICPQGLPPPSPRKQVFLSYISPIHYNSIVGRSSE